MAAIAPSILAADFANLGAAVAKAEAGGADRLHIDVMDGHFVPNLSMGPVVVQALRPHTKLPLEVHLMVDDPARVLELFVKAGADTLIIHYEVMHDPRLLLREIRAYGKKVGLAINPGTSVDVLLPYFDEIDLALCMTVWPGFGGQSYLPESTDRIRRLADLIVREKAKCELEVDGGIDSRTAAAAIKSGATVLVAGTAIFAAPEGPTEATRLMAAIV